MAEAAPLFLGLLEGPIDGFTLLVGRQGRQTGVSDWLSQVVKRRVRVAAINIVEGCCEERDL